MALTVRLGDEQLAVAIGPDRAVAIGDARFVVDAIEHGLYRVSNGERVWTIAVAGPVDRRWVSVEGCTAVLEISDESYRGRPRRGGTSHELTAPMPATVTRLLVEPGATVRSGDTLLVLEAMKMELAIRAPQDGTIGAIHCKVGDLVQPGVALLDFA